MKTAPPRPSTVPDVLDAAADHIEQFGWCTGTQIRWDGHVCADGALNAVATGNAETEPWTNPGLAAKDALGQALGADPTHANYAPDIWIKGWNDDRDRTADEVIATLRRVAEQRRQAGDHLRSWSTPWPDYQPVDVTPDELRGPTVPDWAEPGDDPTVIDWPPRQAAALVPFDVVDGRPRNPGGRTGRIGRNLRAWGENQAVDPVLVAGEMYEGYSVLLIRREDTGQWALPGGHVEAGETALAALVRELREETGVDLAVDVDDDGDGDGDLVVDPDDLIVLARMLVEDPRNTDEAWIASTVALCRVLDQIAPVAGDDAVDAAWLPFDSIAGLQKQLQAAGGELYPAHLGLLQLAHRHLNA